MQNDPMFDWNDLKAFLAVARGGSSLAAARTLKINQTTVSRRIESLEAALGAKLFERGQTGSRLTAAGQDLLADAEAVERAALAVGARASAQQRDLSGTVRLTCTEVIGNVFVMPALAVFRVRHPEIQIDLDLSDRRADLAGGEADVAIRASRVLENSDLVARKVTDYEFALFCSRDYAARKGVPAQARDLADHDLITGEGVAGDMPGMAQMLSNAPGAKPAARSNSMISLIHAVQAGIGIAPLPCILADADEKLLRCSQPIASAQASSWIVTRRDVREVPRVRALVDFLTPHLQKDARRRIEVNAERLRRDAEASGGRVLLTLSSPA
jgi:DNA-binding transcriptional LysR family regulator